MQRHYTFLDRICLHIDQALRTLNHTQATTNKKNPGDSQEEATLSDRERKEAARLMRINHAGEVCAQALYHGQAVSAKNKAVQEKMREAALEEGDHLTWCRSRLLELGSHTSYLNPLWYAGSFCIGMLAGIAGDRVSLGFVAETEKQVVKHLEKHQQLLPGSDLKSQAILAQMTADEAKHQADAMQQGALNLPPVIKLAMTMTSKVMVKTAYYL